MPGPGRLCELAAIPDHDGTRAIASVRPPGAVDRQPPLVPCAPGADFAALSDAAFDTGLDADVVALGGGFWFGERGAGRGFGRGFGIISTPSSDRAAAGEGGTPSRRLLGFRGELPHPVAVGIHQEPALRYAPR